MENEILHVFNFHDRMMSANLRSWWNPINYSAAQLKKNSNSNKNYQKESLLKII